MKDSHLYRLVSIEPTTAPDGGSGPWYRYEIASGHARISGCRAGSPDEVRRHALDCVERLNGRLQDEPRAMDTLRSRRNVPVAPPGRTRGAEAG